MAQMSIRSTYALDEQTAQRIRHLARVWGVSQAEVIRRSVERAAAEQHEAAPIPGRGRRLLSAPAVAAYQGANTTDARLPARRAAYG